MTKQQKNRPVELITFTELAKRKGCNKSTAWRACKGRLKAAVVGTEVDFAHEDVQKWMGSTDHEPPPSKGKRGSGPLPTREEFTKLAFRKRRAETERLELHNQERRGDLIERDRVVRHVLGLVDAAFTRLLRDVPQNMALRIFSIAKSSRGTQEDARHALHEAISDILTRTRNEAVRALRKRPAQQRASEASN